MQIRNRISYSYLLPIPIRQNFGPDQTESICRRQIKCNEMIISVFDRVENIAGKGEKACTSKILLFSPRFQKASSPDPSKGVIVQGWAKPPLNKPWFLRVCSTSLF